jgi:4-hydroxybutyrate CoA-transferase
VSGVRFSMSSMKKALKVSAEEAVGNIKSGDRVMVSEGPSEPQTLVEALVNEKERLKNVEIVGGLFLNYKFLEPGLEESFSFRTWQCTSAISKLVGERVKYLPVRMSDVPFLFSKNGPYPVDVALIHVSPPDRHGFCSLGISVANALTIALDSKLVIAQVNDQMPRVLGNSFIHLSQIDYVVESSRPLVEFPSRQAIGDSHREIAKYVSELIPDGATLQIGIGAIPEAIVAALVDKHDLKFYGMGTDYMVDLVERGVISKTRDWSTQCKIKVAAVAGTKKVFDFVHDNPLVEGMSSFESFSPMAFSKMENFVSIQSAFEVDLLGQVNTEIIDGIQVSAIGGGYDFLECVRYSPGGKSVIAMLSTSPRGGSRIVKNFSAGTAIAYPRHTVDYVVTEYGVAYLKGKALDERVEALIAIAHPDFREELST